MGLESATYVNDLVTSNPLATDVKSQGDDHLRLIKTVLKGTFPNASKKFYLPQGASLQSADVTVATTDDNKFYPINCQAASRFLNLPQGSTVWDGFTIKVIKADHTNNTLTIDGYGSETINGSLTLVLWQRYQSAILQYVSGLSGWIAQYNYIPPIGEITPHSANTIPTDAGWLLLNGTAIGNASSAASQRANGDCRGLFYHLWNQYNNTTCPVSGGRGSSAGSDFDANKTLGLPDLRGRTFAGLDDMGSSAAGRLGNILAGATTNGSVGGVERNLLAQANLPNIAPSISIYDPGHSHGHRSGYLVRTNTTVGGGALSVPNGATIEEMYIDYATTGITATASSINGGVSQTYVGNMQPTMVGSWKIKL